MIPRLLHSSPAAPAVLLPMNVEAHIALATCAVAGATAAAGDVDGGMTLALAPRRRQARTLLIAAAQRELSIASATAAQHGLDALRAEAVLRAADTAAMECGGRNRPLTRAAYETIVSCMPALVSGATLESLGLLRKLAHVAQ